MDGLVQSDRRTFMRRGAMGAGALWMLSLGELSARGGHRRPVIINGVSPYGPVKPTKDQTTGLELLKLPEGFRYWSYSWTGDTLSDGVICPNLHDGMAVVDASTGAIDDHHGSKDGRFDPFDFAARGSRREDDKLILVRNHEGSAGTPYLTGRPDITYAPAGRSGAGGTTNLVFNLTHGHSNQRSRAWPARSATAPAASRRGARGSPARRRRRRAWLDVRGRARTAATRRR